MCNSLEHIRLDAVMDNVPPLLEYTRGCLLGRGLGEAAVTRLELAVEEILVNIVNYAYHEGSGDIELRLAGRSGLLDIEIRDRGKAFNPLERSDPDTTASLEDREIGGLGIYFARKIADEIAYRREDDENVLTLTIPLP